MSLRLRLTVLVASVFLGFWLIASIWMMAGLSHKLEVTFDKRLRSTAIMLNNLLAHVPQNSLGDAFPAIIEANEIGSDKGLTCQISSLHGSIIASNNSTSFPSEAKLAQGFSYLSSGHLKWRTFTLISKQHKITIADKVAERESLYHNLLKSILIPPALAIFVTLALLWFAIGRGISPIQLLALAIEKRGSNDLDPIQLHTASKELQPLIASQNALMARLAEGITREKQFTSNAAHELRTPLTGIMSQIQLAEMTDGEIQQKALRQVKRSANRLNAILDNLLVLARVDANISLQVEQPWSLKLLITNLLQETNQDITRIAVTIKDEQLVSCIPSLMIAIVCRNLLDNALKYSIPNTPVIIEAHSAGDFLTLEFRNNADVSPIDLPKVTTRFWRKGLVDGAGLGLSIVDTIAEKYKGALTVNNDEQIFVVQFSVPV